MTTTQTKDRLVELRAALQTKAGEIEAHAASWKDETGNGDLVITTEQHAAYVKTIGEAEDIKSRIVAEEKALGITEFLNAPPPGSRPAAGEDAVEGGARRITSLKTLGRRWLDSDAYQEMKSSGFRSFGQLAQFEGMVGGKTGGLDVKDVYSAMAGTFTLPALGTQENLGLTPRMLRPGRVRDLFPAEATTANLLYGIRETGFINRAAVVPERRAADGVSAPTGGPTDVYGLKPRSDLTLVPVTYPLATIAHIMYVHKQTLDDEPRMQGLIDRDMTDGVKMLEDWEILYGDGIGDNLTGIFNTPGVQVYAGASSDRPTAQIRRAMTRSILAYFQPNGVVMHPLDWEELELEQDRMGAYVLAVNVAIGGQQQVWRLNVVDTSAIAQGKYLLGSFGMGAKLYDREQVNIQVSTENRDMFERNAVTLRCEERLGLVVDRPESFVIGTLTGYVDPSS